MSLAGASSGNMYGCGLYFTDDWRKAMQYAIPNGLDQQGKERLESLLGCPVKDKSFILFCRVPLGVSAHLRQVDQRGEQNWLHEGPIPPPLQDSCNPHVFASYGKGSSVRVRTKFCQNQDCVNNQRDCVAHGLMVQAPKKVCTEHAYRYTSVVAEPVQGPQPSAREFVWFGTQKTTGVACAPIALLSFEHKDQNKQTVQFAATIMR